MRSVEEVWDECALQRVLSCHTVTASSGVWALFGYRGHKVIDICRVGRTRLKWRSSPEDTINLTLLELTQEFLDYGT